MYPLGADTPRPKRYREPSHPAQTPAASERLPLESMAMGEQDAVVRDFISAAKKYHPQLLSLARKLTRRYDEAEDIVQHALLKGFSKLSSFRGEAQMRTWLAAIVLNTAREYLRNQGGRTFLSLDHAADGEAGAVNVCDHSQDAEQLYVRRENHERVWTALSQMTAADQRILEMCVLGETPYVHAATSLNVSVSALKSQVFRSKRRLRNLLSMQANRTIDNRNPA